MDLGEHDINLHPLVVGDPWATELLPIVCSPTGRSSGGYPYLERPAYQRLRDWVPYLLADGLKVLDTVDKISRASQDFVHLTASCTVASKVIGQVVRTAAVTAPPDLWLLEHILSAFAQKGWLTSIREGNLLDVSQLDVNSEEVLIDFNFLLSRGLLFKQGQAFRMSNHPTSVSVWTHFKSDVREKPTDLASIWMRAFSGDKLSAMEIGYLRIAPESVPVKASHGPPAWVPTVWDIFWSARLLPIVLGLRAAGRTGACLESGSLNVVEWLPTLPELHETIEQVAFAAGWLRPDRSWTGIGRRVLSRGAGPMGIIAAYAPYMDQLDQIWKDGRHMIHVQRGPNIAASQDANSKTFATANDSLDSLCEQTGFSYSVYIEHALGKGEATRQRFERSGDDEIRYIGADLEWAAIEASRIEKEAGRLPSNMALLGGMDIGDPETLIAEVRKLGLKTEGAVMIVGNGFHEVREQTDAKLIAIFATYEKAGIVLLFTEESALSTADLLETAWNTYHAGFRYVHERSGQGLRAATPTPPSQFGDSLRLSWKECAERGGYIRVDALCGRGRTIYPYVPINGHNPSVSANHFYVPLRIGKTLGFV